MLLGLIFVLLVAAAPPACRAAPPGSTKTSPPFLSLTEHAAEPKDVGWCLDLQGAVVS